MTFRSLLNCLWHIVLSHQPIMVWLKFPMKTSACECETTSSCLWKTASMFVSSRQPTADTPCHIAHTYLFYNPYPWTLGHACPPSALCSPAVLSHKEKLPWLTFADCPSKTLHLALAALVMGESCHHFCNITQISSCLPSRLHTLAYKFLRETPWLLTTLKVAEASSWHHDVLQARPCLHAGVWDYFIYALLSLCVPCLLHHLRLSACKFCSSLPLRTVGSSLLVFSSLLSKTNVLIFYKGIYSCHFKFWVLSSTLMGSCYRKLTFRRLRNGIFCTQLS